MVRLTHLDKTMGAELFFHVYTSIGPELALVGFYQEAIQNIGALLTQSWSLQQSLLPSDITLNTGVQRAFVICSKSGRRT